MQGALGYRAFCMFFKYGCVVKQLVIYNYVVEYPAPFTGFVSDKTIQY